MIDPRTDLEMLSTEELEKYANTNSGDIISIKYKDEISKKKKVKSFTEWIDDTRQVNDITLKIVNDFYQHKKISHEVYNRFYDCLIQMDRDLYDLKYMEQARMFPASIHDVIRQTSKIVEDFENRVS